MISPRIWEDPSFNKLNIGARLLFIGMISNADDEGYIRADIGSLKRLIFGFDNELSELPNWIEKLVEFKNIHFYKKDDEKYAHFLKWNDYQKQQKDRIQKSDYPKCSVCVAGVKQMPPKVKLSKVKLSKDSILGTSVPKTRKDQDIFDIITMFKNVNPSYKSLYEKNNQRQAVARLLKEHGREKLISMIEALPAIITKPYAPKATTPYLLELKLGELLAFAEQNKAQKIKII